jgi:hypothetical protein
MSQRTNYARLKKRIAAAQAIVIVSVSTREEGWSHSPGVSTYRRRILDELSDYEVI